VQRLADGPTWAIRWSKLAVNKWLKHQANLIMDAGLAYEAITLTTQDHKEAVKRLLKPPLQLLFKECKLERSLSPFSFVPPTAFS